MKRLLATVLASGLLTACVVTTEDPGSAPVAPETGRSDGPAPGDGYSFLHTVGDRRPVRWSTCEPIEYVVRERNEPPQGRRLLRESVRRISEATGLELVFRGTTEEAPSESRPPYDPDRYGDRWSPVLVAWSDPEEYPALKGRTAGFGGATHVRSRGRAARYVSGLVVLDADQLATADEDQVRAVLTHELAHVVGLGHVDDRGQLMNPVQYGRGVNDLQDGDLAGLEILGAGRCYEPIDPGTLRRPQG